MSYFENPVGKSNRNKGGKRLPRTFLVDCWYEAMPHWCPKANLNDTSPFSGALHTVGSQPRTLPASANPHCGYETAWVMSWDWRRRGSRRERLVGASGDIERAGTSS